MSQNTEMVQQAYRYIQSGEIQAFLSLLAEDILWEMPEMPNVPFGGVRHGRQRVRDFFQTLAEVQDVVEFVPEDFIAQGDRVVALGRFVMRVKATGKESRSAWAHVWTIENGQAIRFREYVDTLAVSQAYTGP